MFATALEGESVRLPTLGEIAARDVRLAHALIQSGRVNCQPGPGFGVIEERGWQMINLIGRWESGAADPQVEARLVENICADLWVCDVRTTVRRPLFAAGSLWKAQSDFYNSLNPGIDFTLVTKNNCYDLAISPDPTPFENVRGIFRSSCPFGIVLTCGATFDGLFTYTRSLTEAGVLPMEAIVTFSGIRLKNGAYRDCHYSDAVKTVQGVLAGAMSP